MAIGTGLAFASAATSGAYGTVLTGHRNLSKIDAFFVDRTIQLPDHVTVFVATAARTLPVVGIELDAAAHAGLMGVLARTTAIVGISSGATLFCLERLAGDHGFRLAQHHAQPAIEARWQDMASLLNGQTAASDPTKPIRCYAPSRADGVLHSWLMEKRDCARSGRNRGVRS